MSRSHSDVTKVGSVTVDEWFHVASSGHRPHLRLFCLPPMGGSAAHFRDWSHHSSAFVELWAVDPPGRGSRHGVASRRRMDDLARELADAMEPHLDRPYSMFGHSLGGLVAFETVRALRRRGAPQPHHLFLAAIHAPDRGPYRRGIYDLPRNLLVKELTEVWGHRSAALGDEDILDLVLPYLRADCELYEHYAYSPEAPLDCAITAFHGTHDPLIQTPDVAAWAVQTVQSFNLEVFEGDHFFPEQTDFVRRLLSEISTSLGPAGAEIRARAR